jgi:hypothetical protein
MADYGFLR